MNNRQERSQPQYVQQEREEAKCTEAKRKEKPIKRRTGEQDKGERDIRRELQTVITDSEGLGHTSTLLLFSVVGRVSVLIIL